MTDSTQPIVAAGKAVIVTVDGTVRGWAQVVISLSVDVVSRRSIDTFITTTTHTSKTATVTLNTLRGISDKTLLDWMENRRKFNVIFDRGDGINNITLFSCTITSLGTGGMVTDDQPQNFSASAFAETFTIAGPFV